MKIRTQITRITQFLFYFNTLYLCNSCNLRSNLHFDTSFFDIEIVQMLLIQLYSSQLSPQSEESILGLYF